MVFLSYYARGRYIPFFYHSQGWYTGILEKCCRKNESNNINSNIDEAFVDDGCTFINMTATFPHVRGLSYLSLMYSSCKISSCT